MTKHYISLIALFVLMIGAGLFFAKTTSEKATVTFTTGGANDTSPQPSASPVVQLEGGLTYQDLVIGTGTDARTGDTIAAHYIGTLTNGTKFDSSYDRGQPYSLILGGGMVIRGWDIGIVGMKVGGKRKLVIPPALAYGDREVGNGLIPANSTLIFEVELVAVQHPK